MYAKSEATLLQADDTIDLSRRRMGKMAPVISNLGMHLNPFDLWR